jgi:heterodisulfide reductase subunit A
MITIIINGRKIEVAEGTTLLEAAKSIGVEIPTLCHHPALTPYGACRLCLVEVKSGAKPGLVAACHSQAREGLSFETDTPTVLRTRRVVLELLLARTPGSEILRELAAKNGLREPRLRRAETSDCILCGLCVRMCRERMGQSVLGFAFRGDQRRVGPAFDKTSPACIACGACEFVCPTNAVHPAEFSENPLRPLQSEFEAGLGRRPVVSTLYPQAIPNVPTIDREHCLHFNREACGVCRKVCEAGAVDYDQRPRTRELEVGAVILSPGFEMIDAGARSEYGFGVYPNVVTSRQFERILSASGPSKGEVVRPSDGAHPKKIAFISCVGSRDQAGGHSYCSSVCCMASTKEAIIAKEHQADIEPSIFYMDMRAFGKGFERYYSSAREKYGVRYVRCLVSRLYEHPQSKNLKIKYLVEDGFAEEEFDLVVLAAGLTPSARTRRLAAVFGVDLDAHGFCRKTGFSSTRTSTPGVFASGVFAEPKDIPETVIEASAAAAEASELLADRRGTLTVEKAYPEERELEAGPPRIGVFVCRCGRNIGGVVDVPAVVRSVRELPHVVFADENLYTCSQDSLEKIKGDIQTHNLTRVVVASCTPTTHAPLFRDTVREAGLNPYLFEMASLREHVSWVHGKNPEKATEKAKQVTAMAVAKAALLAPIRMNVFEINKEALVLGGGLAGMTAALSLADQGFRVHLVEKSDRLGGHLAELYDSLNRGDPQALRADLDEKVRNHGRIRVYLQATAEDVSGYLGNFTTRLKLSNGGGTTEIRHGVIIVATGAKEYEPDEYLFGRHPGVMTQTRLEKRLTEGGAEGWKSVVMIQCVGSRDDRHPYCSRVCCGQAVKNALRLKEVRPEAEVVVLYRDIRTYGTREDAYLEARRKGVLFVRFDENEKPVVSEERGRLSVEVLDRSLGRKVKFTPDAVVLSAGIVPQNEALSQTLKLPLTEDGFFMEAHAKIRPLDFTAEGVYLAGLAHSPRTIEETVAQAKGAAVRAVTLLSKDKILAKAEIPVVNAKWCSGCGSCVRACPYDARRINPATRVAEVVEVLCQACGACTVACPSGASGQKGFEKREIFAQIETALAE